MLGPSKIRRLRIIIGSHHSILFLVSYILSIKVANFKLRVINELCHILCFLSFGLSYLCFYHWIHLLYSLRWWNTEAELHRWVLRERAFLTDVSGATYRGCQCTDANVPSLSLPTITDNGPTAPYLSTNHCGPRDNGASHRIKTCINCSQHRWVSVILIYYYRTGCTWLHVLT